MIGDTTRHDACLKVPLERIFQLQDFHEMTPAQLSRQRRDNLGVRKNLGESQHPE
jgi:hypothetical protein